MRILELFGGIALFLFGLKLMGDGLKSVAGNKLELFLYRLSNTPLKGVLLGTGVTAMIQSSCATSVMAVGFVNSGMMKLKQAVGVILGAILGTSITGWIICLNYIDGTSGLSGIFSSSSITSIVAVVGIILCSFIKTPRSRHIGGILMGFSVLMFGMSTMSDAVSSLGEQEAFRSMLVSLENPILGVLAGFLFTAILQSASSAVGIIQALSVSGTITIGISLPLLMGVAIGASVPVLLSAIGASSNGKRASLIYPVTTTLSVMVCASVFYICNAIFNFPFLGTTADPFIIAGVNSVLRFAMVLILLPFSDVIEALVKMLVKERAKQDGDRPLLEEIFIAHPALAIDQSKTAISEMAEKSDEALSKAIQILFEYKNETFEQVKALEESVDKYEDSLGTYLVKLTGRELTHQQNKDVSTFLHTLSDFERISDHALNIAESAKELKDKEIVFSPDAVSELKVITSAVSEIVNMTVSAFVSGSVEHAKNVEPLEECIDELCDRIKLNHVERLQRGDCTIKQGFVLNDLLTDFERVSDHCSNIAVAMIELDSEEFDTHKYLSGVKTRRTEDFERKYEEYSAHYKI
ncbi:MAG: Na/Pi cotransporter family protein [Clostridia bacterium]|nr:Na/Pi cotransporter family protein [Clostridia bacterium]